MSAPHTEPSSPELMPLDKDVQFVAEWVNELSGDHLNSLTRVEEEAEIIKFVRSMEAPEARVQAVSVLIRAIQNKSPELQALIAERDERKFGQRITEIMPGNLSRIGERLLSGKNVAAVIRASDYDDLETDIIAPLCERLGLSQTGEAESFPNRGMIQNGAQSSALHVDIIHKQNDSTAEQQDRFPYALSISRIEEGSVLFVAGFASKKAWGWDKTDYEMRKARLNDAPTVKHLFDSAAAGSSPQAKELHVNGPRLDIDLSAIQLTVGDIVIWPQGGGGAERRADWHAFRQIGDTPRTSVTRHFV